MAEVLARLTEEGARQFATEVTEALAVAEETNDLAGVQYVLNAWWVSGLFACHEDFGKALDAADEVGPELLTPEQVGELLGVA
jgi:hypothetical protein